MCDFLIPLQNMLCFHKLARGDKLLLQRLLGVALMSTPSQSSRKIHFEEFELNLETADLRGNGSKAILPGQPFQILVTLLGRPGQLVTREELKRQLWPSDTFVDFDVSLNKAVNRLREGLGDSAEHPRFIETLPRKGYRFVGAVGNRTGTDTRNSADLLPATCQPDAAADALGQEINTEMARGRRAHSYGLRHVPVAAMTLVMVAVVVVAISKRFWVPHGPDLASVYITKLTDSGMAQDVDQSSCIPPFTQQFSTSPTL